MTDTPPTTRSISARNRVRPTTSEHDVIVAALQGQIIQRDQHINALQHQLERNWCYRIAGLFGR